MKDNEHKSMIKRDWNKIQDQVNTEWPWLIVSLIPIILFAVIFHEKIEKILIILGCIPIALVLIRLVGFKAIRRLKIILFILSTSLCIVVMCLHDELNDFIGYSLISGYESHHEEMFVTNYSGTDAAERELEDVLVFNTDTWIGKLILKSLQILLIPLVIIYVYLIWKILSWY